MQDEISAEDVEETFSELEELRPTLRNPREQVRSVGDDGGSQTHLGQIDTQAAAQGDTSGSFVGQFTVQFTKDNFHLLDQPLFGRLNLYDPSLEFQFATDYTWQLQAGWTLMKWKWDLLGIHFDNSLQQAVARQFGNTSKESAWIMNLAQGQSQIPLARSNIYLFAQGTFYGRRNDDDGRWKFGLQGTIGVGWQLEAVFQRSAH